MDRTNAERQRRYIARLKARAGNGPVSNATAGPDHAELERRIAEHEKAGEARDRRIKAQATEIRNLKAHVLYMLERGQMPFKTRGAILKVLHPDQRRNATEADKDEACRLFTSWTGDNNKARRAKSRS